MIRKPLMLALTALTITGLVAAEGVTAGAASRASTTASARWGGQQALDRLGTRLPSVAAANDLSTAQLREHLLDDPTLFVDGNDTLLYVEPALVGPTLVTDTPFDTGIPTANAFLLNSNPSSTKSLFIDFDGELMSGNAWAASSGGDCYAEPYDADGSPSTFNDAERNNIISVWKRIAEDYAMFDINVTTQDPGYAAINRSGSGDNVYGTRVLITNSTQLCPNGKTLYANACGSCGGVAYVGVFGSTGTTHDYYQPALVFQNGVTTNPKYVAEAASHEVGHNIGLSHDGTSSTGYYQGHGSWAPIMGVGYYEAIVQWSKGEYSGANNTQDDFVVAGNNGLPLRADDHGNTTGTATALQGSPATVDGIISTRTDVDAFTVSANAGPATFTAIPSPTSPDLDIKLEIRDSSGNLVASDDPASGSTGYDSPTGMGASISTTLAAGTYTILVDGVGYGDPLNTGYSDYASLGYFRLTATVVGADGQAPTAVATASATSGELPFVVDFTGSNSSDPEGATLTYAWAFGNGDTSTLANPSYTYTTAGSYTVTLTVTDDKSLSNTATMTITVTAPVRKIDVFSISSTGTKTKTGLTVTASITIKDNASANVSGATVTGTWYTAGKASGSKSATTNSSGVATITSGNLKVRTGTQIKFCVTNVTLANGTWLTSVFSPTTATDCTTFIAP